MKPELRLGIARFICYSYFFWIYAGTYHFIGYRNLPESMWLPNGIMTFFASPPLDFEAYQVLNFVFFTSIFLCAIGFLFKWLSWVVAILSLFLIGTAQSYGYFPHTLMPVVLTFFILVGTRSSDAFSVDALLFRSQIKRKKILRRIHGSYDWPVLMVQILFALIFFSAGVSKLRIGGLDWITGETLQNYIFRSYHFYSDTNHFATSLLMNKWIVHFPTLCKVLAGFTVGLELLFPLCLFIKRLRFPFITALILLQFGIYFTIFVNFRMYICLYCFWIPWDRIFSLKLKPFLIRKMYN